MTATQRASSLRAFAAAMLRDSPDFAAAVRAFESHGNAGGEADRALLAQAAFNCWFHSEYQANLLATCRAIGSGSPGHLYLCGHVTPARWRALHAYVVGAQRWLGQDHPVPGLMDAARVEQVAAWLGPPTPARQALTRLFLCQLVDHLVHRTSTCVLTDGACPDSGEFADFSAWYGRPDGGEYGLEEAAGSTGEVDCDAPERVSSARDALQPTESPGPGAGSGYAAACARGALRALETELPVSDAAATAKELVSGMTQASQPPCMHRFERYQDIKLVSIGQLRWRDGVPADDTRHQWQAFWAAAEAGLRGWLDGVPPADHVAAGLHDALGRPNPASRAIVSDFLLQPPPDTGCFDWLLEDAHGRGAEAPSPPGPA